MINIKDCYLSGTLSADLELSITFDKKLQIIKVSFFRILGLCCVTDGRFGFAPSFREYSTGGIRLNCVSSMPGFGSEI